MDMKELKGFVFQEILQVDMDHTCGMSTGIIYSISRILANFLSWFWCLHLSDRTAPIAMEEYVLAGF